MELVERVARALCGASQETWRSGRYNIGAGGILDMDQLNNHWLHKAQAAIAAILHDHVIVPKEPSEAMLDRFVSRALNVSVHGDGGWTKYGREQYRAMIEAAPNPLPH